MSLEDTISLVPCSSLLGSLYDAVRRNAHPAMHSLLRRICSRFASHSLFRGGRAGSSSSPSQFPGVLPCVHPPLSVSLSNFCNLPISPYAFLPNGRARRVDIPSRERVPEYYELQSIQSPLHLALRWGPPRAQPLPYAPIHAF